MSTTTNEPKHVSEITDGILSALLPPDKRITRAGRLRLPLYVVDHCPDLMRAIMHELDEITTMYRAKKAGYQYIWSTSRKFQIVDPFGDEEYYHYDLLVNHATGDDYFTFARVYQEEEAAA